MTPIEEITNRLAIQLADEMWRHLDKDIRDKFVVRIIDRFLRSTIALSDSDIEGMLGAQFDKRVEELMVSEQVRDMLDYCVKKKVAGRITKKLSDYGIDVAALTPDQRAWLERLHYKETAK